MHFFDDRDWLWNRRQFLLGAGSLAGLTLLQPFSLAATPRKVNFAADPFSLGVASGDPWHNSVALWTRLAPEPLNGGGVTESSVEVGWEVASDEQMRNIVARGKTVATAALGHSVHVEVFGLKPARWYWYRFTVGNAASPVGRTRTAPAPNAKVDRFAFAFASCQHYETGYYTAYKHMVAEELDAVVFLGDYIYEYGATAGRTRLHNSAEVKTLTDYRNRYGLYKSDPLLKQAHAAFPWIVTWDDHEVDNNYAGLTAEDNAPVDAFTARRKLAYQVFYEHMPLRPSCLKRDLAVEIYRQIPYGSLLSFNVLDTRQYRTDQPCGDGSKVLCEAALSAQATIMGTAQKRWLFQNLQKSKARWNVLAQQVMVAPFDSEIGDGRKYSMDKWSGYIAERNELMQFLQTRKPSNPVVITGDIHSNWAANLKADFDRPESAVVGAEFVGTSISSGGDGLDSRPGMAQMLAENPHIKFFNGQRGYVRCVVTPERWQSDYRIVPVVSRPDGEVNTRATFVAENGKPGLQRA